MKWRTLLTGMLVCLVLVATMTVAVGCKPKVLDKAQEAVEEKVAETAKTVVAKAATVVSETPTKESAPAKATKPSTKTESDDDDDEDEPIKLSAADDLDSYREKIVWKSESSGEDPQHVEMLLEYERETPARRIVQTHYMASGESETSELIQIGDTTYMGMGDEWVTMQSEDAEEDVDDHLTGWADPSSIIDDCKRKGKDTINGMACLHYACDEKAFQQQALLGYGAAGIKVLEGSYDFWISTKHNIAVKTIWTWRGEDPDGNPYSWSFESEVIDINKPVDIEKPEGAQEAGLPEDIPLIDGAAEVNTIGPMVMFKVAQPQAEVIAYYEQQMTKNGWAKEDAPVPMMMTFTKGERTAQVIVGEGDEVEVTIMVQEEQ